MISLNVQWIPVNNRSGAYQWSGTDVSSQKMKTVTFFGTGEMRGQQQAKVITPPGSDYTDAYLSAFASKPIPSRHVHRLTTSVFDNSTPIPLKPTSTPLSTSSSMKTSQTRFTTINNIQTSDSFNKPIPSSPDRSSTYSSSFGPERSTTYETFPRTPYSSPQSQTFTSSYSTLLRTPTSPVASTPSPSVDSQRSYTTFQTRSQPLPSSAYPTVYRSEADYKNLYKPLPPYSIQSYPPSNTYTTSLSSSSTESTYKPYVSSQSFPLSSSYNINQSSTSERIVLPTTKIEKQIDRPETLLFQPDEDIRSSRIEKPTPIFSPSPESPMTREELKVEPERLHVEELPATTSEPITILENTLSKYDSLINQISEVLASVSPLSSTVSSMSPGKSVLDYQISSDSSPILPHKHVESQASQQSPTTSTAKSSGTQRTKPAHLIRDDSYDKIVTAISDLDNEITSSSDILKSSPTIKEEKEEAKTSSLDKSQVPSITEEVKVQSNLSSLTDDQTQLATEHETEEAKVPSMPQEETKTSSTDEQTTPSVTEEEAAETKTASTKEQQGPSVTEEEAKTSSLDEYQTSPITEEEKKQETQTTSIDEQQTASTSEDIKEETKTSLAEEQATSVVTEEEKEEAKTSLAEEQQVPSVSEEVKEEEAKTSLEAEQGTPSVTEEEAGETKTTLTIEQQGPSVTEEEKKEETQTASIDEQQTTSTSEDIKEETKTSLAEEQLTPAVTEEETKTSLAEEQTTPAVTEEEKEEEKTLQAEEQQVPSVSKEVKEEETKTSLAEEQVTSSVTEEEAGETKTSVADEQATPSVTKEEAGETKPTLTIEQQGPSVTEEEKKEETQTASIDEQQTTSTSEDIKEETKASPAEEQLTSAVTEEEKEEAKTSLAEEQQVPSVSEEVKEEEAKTSSTDEQATPFVTEEEAGETKTTSTKEQQGLSITEEEANASLLDEYKTTPITEEGKKEETQIALIDEQQTTSTSEDIKQETKTLSTDEQGTPSVTEEEKEEAKTAVAAKQATPSVTEEEKEEAKTSLAEEQQVPSVSKEVKEEEAKTSPTDEQATPSVIEEEKKEETKDVPEDEHQVPSSIREEEEKETKTSLTDESQALSITEEDKQEGTTTVSLDEHPATSPAEEKKEETIFSSTDEHQLSAASEGEKIELKTSLPEEHPVSLVTELENEEAKIESSDEHQTPSVIKEEMEETKISLPDEQQPLSVTEELQNLPAAPLSDTSVSEILQSSQTKADEEKVADEQSIVETTPETAEFVQQQTGLLTNVPNDVPVTEVPEEASVNLTSTKKKRVTWDETVVDNEDDESSSCQSVTDETSPPIDLITTTSEDNSATADESKTAIDEQLTSSDITEPQITSEQTIHSLTSIEPSIALSSTGDQQGTLPNSAELQTISTEQQISPSSHPEDQTNLQAPTNEQVHQTDIVDKQIIPSDSTEQQIRSPSPLETSSTSSDFTNQQSVSSDVTESQLSHNEQQIHPTSPIDTESVSITDSSKEDTFTIDEVSATTSDIISNEDTSKRIEESETIKTESKEEASIDEHKVETSSQVAESAPHESEISVIESGTSSVQPTIVSPIDTLADTVANRYISSDVYHGYLGEHQQFLQDASDVDNDSTTKSLLASLRETITTPITPLIETIQSVVSSMQTTPAIHPSKIEGEAADHTEDETRLTTAIVTQPTEVSDDKTQVEEDKSTVDTSEKLKTVFESLREAVTAPITAITETIQTAVSNLQSDKQEVQSTSDTEQFATPLEDKVSTVVAKSSSDVVGPSDETTADHSNKEIEQTQSSLLDSIQEKVSKAITTLTETVQNVVSTNVSSTETHKEDEQAVQQEKSDTQPSEHGISADTIRDEAIANRQEPYDSFVTDTTILTSADTTNLAAESANEQKEKQETISAESLPSEIPEFSSSIVQKTEEATAENIKVTPVIQHDEQVSTAGPGTLEQADISDKQETISIESSPADIPSIPSVDQKAEELSSTEDKTFESSIPTSVSQHDEQLSTPTAIPSEQLAITDKPEVASSEISSETPIEQKLDENASTETKTTLEVIRDVITHPLATITEKIQSVISTSTSEHVDQVSSDATNSSTDTLEQTEISEKQPSLETVDATTIEHKPDSATESKTTFETIRDAITHPLTTITEKIQSVISSSTTEEVPSSEQQTTTTTADQNKDEDITSTTTKSTFEPTPDTITNSSTEVDETIDDVVSNTIDQTSSSQEKEQILTTEGSESYLQDQIQGEQEISSITLPSPISDNEKPIQTTESESEHITNEEIQDSVSHKTDDANKLLIDTIQNLINDTINKVIFNLNQNIIENEPINQEIFSSDSSLTSPVTVLNVEDRSESSQSTINQETITNEEDITWNNLVGKKSSDEKLNQSYEEVKQLLEDIVQSSDNITEDKTTSLHSNQTQSPSIIENTTQQPIITSQIDDVMQRSSNELESDSTSATTEIENIPSKPSTEFRESSPTNTEDDSLELIHALHGHSIILPSSPNIQIQTTTNQPSGSTSTIEKTDEQILQVPEKSSSSTTSSQITSSDRYVSYAIHEMGDSSQERLPAFPLAADIPIYEFVKTTSDENKEQQILSEPIVNINQNLLIKDDDLTELDATENLTSYSDDILLQKLQTSIPHRKENLDASSTDEDVDDENFNEFDQHDTSNLQHIIEEIAQQNNSLSGEDEQTYQRYDISSNSSISTKQQTDDIYIIPGYPGLWKPSADDDTHSSLANDADDEDEKNPSATTVKTRTIVRTTDPTKLQSILQQQQQQNSPVRPDSIDIFTRPLNEFSFDLSESDSFKTCPSTINSSIVSKQQKQSELFESPIIEQEEHQISPDEKIFLIRERERGVSLPVTMKINYDDMALRLSESTPIETQLYSTTETDLPSPSTHSEPMQKTTSSSRASTPSLSSNESEQQKIPSSPWLNTINTITTTTEGPDGPLESRTTIQKTAKGPISIAECDAQGKYILIENTSRSKSIALASWTIRQESDDGNILTFTFPDNCLLRPNHSLKIFTKPNESERRNSDLIASLLSSWHTGSNIVTKLINADGKDRASLTKKTLFS